MPEAVLSGRAVNLTYRTEELEEVAGKLLKAAGSCRVWLFSGELGAGKTTLIKAICRKLGVAGNMSSPGFSIVNEYDSDQQRIFHFDFYRLKKEEEAYDIGVDEYLDSGNYCFIEWPERIPSLVPTPHLDIVITIADTTQRHLDYQLHE